MEVNPLPAVMGRVCYHPCETACNRGQLDEAVGINSVERFLGDEALRQGWTVTVDRPPTGKHVLVIGSGPAGLSAAYHLARAGHEVTIKEASERAGGMMRYAIPRYRLPREVLDGEIDRILALGVHLELNAEVDDLDRLLADESYDAVFLAVGARLARRTYLPAGSAARVLDALALLRAVAEDEPPLLGRRVAVYGGGNTALDAARAAKRLGAEDAVVVYRRTRERMPAHEQEMQEAEDEGIRFRWLSTIDEVDAEGITIETMELDETGFPQPTGRTERLAADSVVLALGQDTDLSLLGKDTHLDVHDGVVVTQAGSMATNRAGVFAGGDVSPGDRSVTVAVGHGTTGRGRHRRLARRYDRRRTAAGRPGAVRGAEHLVLRGRPAPAPPAAGDGPAPVDLRGGRPGPRRRDRAVRGPAVPVLRRLHLVRQLLRLLPRQRRDQARARGGVRGRPRLLQGLRPVRRGVPDRLDADGARRGVSPGGRTRSRPYTPSRGAR